ncbi:MAG: glycosyltransferase family 4 protein [Spirochaetes bacterium]|jgi:glycosyltransferase involved in cell wall biosynthesis|nr:glycosyltransferase family 4 protein [Spirochaetota bacterium]
MNTAERNIPFNMENRIPAGSGKQAGPRILLILTEFPPKIGGMQTHAYYLAMTLYSRGYAIRVISYVPEDDEEESAVREHDSVLPFTVSRVLSRIGFWKNLSRLDRMGKEFSPDIVYSSTVFYGFLGPMLGVPVVSRSVGNDVLRPWIVYPFRLGCGVLSNPWIERRLYNFFKGLKGPDWVDRLFRRTRRRIMTESVMKISRIFANSEFTANLLYGLGVPRERIDMVVGGVDSAVFDPAGMTGKGLRQSLGLPEEGFIILTACRLVEKKGIDFLLSSMPGVLEKIPSARLLIVGDGPLADRYRALSESLGLGGRVIFAGRVPHGSIRSYYWCSDVFVLASRERVHPKLGVRDAETMGRVLCEANAAGLPVLASSSGGINSVIVAGENGLLFETGNSEDFIGKLVRLKRDRSLAGKISRAGLRAARERFDWSVVIGAHERVFEELAGVKNRGRL